MDSADSGPDLRDYAALLRRRWRTVAAGVLAGLAAAAVALLVAPETYTATSSVQVRPTGLAELTGERSGRTNGDVNLDTEAQVVRSAQVATAAAELMGTRASAAELRERVTVTVPPNSSVLEIAYSAIGPDSARQGAEAFADAYLAHRTAEVESQVDRRLDALRKAVDSRYGELEDLAETADDDSGGADQIRAETRLEAVQTEIADLNGEIDPLAALRESIVPGGIITAATAPDSPSSPVPAVWLSGGALLGLLAGLALAVADDRGDGRLHGIRDIRRVTRPAMLLDLSDAGRATRAVGLVPVSGPAGQHVNGVAHTLSARMGQGGHVLVVPGASNGDAGMVAAANLAAAFARIDTDVLLVCADPREAAEPAAEDGTGARGHGSVSGRLTVAEHTASTEAEPEGVGRGATENISEDGGQAEAKGGDRGEPEAAAEGTGEGPAGAGASPSGGDAESAVGSPTHARDRRGQGERSTGESASGTARATIGRTLTSRPARVARENSGPAAGLLDLPEGPGLAEVLADGVDPALLECRPEGLPGLRVLRHGRPGTSELLQREAMADLVRDLRGRARFVIIATAPTSERADAQAIAAAADGVLPAVELGRTRVSELTAAVDHLVAMGTEVAAIAVVPARVGPRPVIAPKPQTATTTVAGTAEATATTAAIGTAGAEAATAGTAGPTGTAEAVTAGSDGPATGPGGVPAENTGGPLGAEADKAPGATVDASLDAGDATALSPAETGAAATANGSTAARVKRTDATTAKNSAAAGPKGRDTAPVKDSNAGTASAEDPAPDTRPRAVANGGKRHAAAAAAEPSGLTVTVPVDDVGAGSGSGSAPAEADAPTEAGIATSTSSMAPSSATGTAATTTDDGSAGNGTSDTPAPGGETAAGSAATSAKSSRKGGKRPKGAAKRTARSRDEAGGVTATSPATPKDTAAGATGTAPAQANGKAVNGAADGNSTKTAPGTRSPADANPARGTAGANGKNGKAHTKPKAAEPAPSGRPAGTRTAATGASGGADDQGADGDGDTTGSDLSLHR